VDYKHNDRAVLWDLDGTLVDTSACHWLAWQQVMAEEGHEFTHAQFIQTFGQRNDFILRLFIDPQMTDAEVERLAGAKETRYRSLLQSRGVILMPGAAHWLARLRSTGWRQALASSAPWPNVEVSVNSPELRGWLEALVSAEDVHHGKPDPEVFLLAAARVGVDPSRCVVVEDAPAGIEGARRAGMRCIGVGAAYQKLPADWQVATLLDLPDDAFERLLLS
jgi:beta-phosphoglucomutase family hydrolase